MREYIFHGKSKETGKWIEGYYACESNHACFQCELKHKHYIFRDEFMDWSLGGLVQYEVYPKSVGQYTGMNEFMLTDETRNAPIFEGDIVEVWGWRSVYGRDQSQYDKRIKVRGVVYLNSRGQWSIDYENKYNDELAKLKGSETNKRQVHGAYELYYYGYHGKDIEKYRTQQLEWHGKFHNPEDIHGHDDIVKIGNVFENANLLESDVNGKNINCQD